MSREPVNRPLWIITWVSDVFEVYRDVPFPNANRFVIRSRHKSPVFVYKGNRVDRIQMSIVLLDNISRTNVPTGYLDITFYCFFFLETVGVKQKAKYRNGELSKARSKISRIVFRFFLLIGPPFCRCIRQEIDVALPRPG